MWEQQSKFWMEFQQQLRQTYGTTQLPAETEEYKLEVRHLFSLRGQVLPQHRDDYFPRRLAEFLEQSTPSQLKTYITNYKPAIRESIREALKRSTNSRRIYQFPGFRRHDLPPLDSETIPHTNASNNIHHRTHHRTTITTATTSLQPRTFTQTTLFGSHTNSNITSNTRERPPHKHSRWKPLRTAQLWLHASFSKSNQPQANDKEKLD